MKIIGCILFSILYSLSGFAQSPDSVKSRKSEYYVGLRLNNTSYYLHFKHSFLDGNFVALPIIHIGYHLTKRSAVQIGLTYGKQKFEWTDTYNNEEGRLIKVVDIKKTKALILPITWRYTLNPAKRFQYFGSASIVLGYGSISEKVTGKTDQVTTSTYQGTAKGFNVFATGTLGINYQISKQWEGNAELIFLNANVKELTGLRTSPVITGPRIFKVIGLGINYKL